MRRLLLFVLIAIGAMWLRGETRSQAMKCWDGSDFGGSEDTERRFSDFIGELTFTPDSATVSEAFRELLGLTGDRPDAVKRIAELADKYLYTWDSPLLNEEFHIYFLRSYLEMGHPEEADSLRAIATLADLGKNRSGRKIAEAAMALATGEEVRLLDHVNATGQTMVIFYDIDCERCIRELDALGRSARLQRAVADGRLRVLALYAGTPSAEWKERSSTIPETWVSASVPDAEDLFAFPWLPALYILGSDGVILAKDVDPTQFH